MRSNEELKLLIDSVIPENIKQNHEMFYTLFQIFFEYISDAYMLGANPNLLIEPDETLWDSKYSSLYHTDLKEIKKELIKTYLYDYHKFIDAMENDPEIYTYFKDVYNNTVNEHLIDIDLFVSRINTDEFLSHKRVSQQKTIPILFNYLMSFFKKMDIPNIHGTDTFLEMIQGSPMNPKRPFAYTVNSSIPKPVYEKAIHSRIHPVGFGSDFKYESPWTLQDFVNLQVFNEDWKVYTITTVKDNAFFDYKVKTKKMAECSLTYRGDELISQFDVNYPNTLSQYGKNITDAVLAGDGRNLIRVSENEYKLVSSSITSYDSVFNGVKLVEPNSSGSYSDYNETAFNEQNHLSAHGGMIATDGSILVDGQTVPGYKVTQGVVMVEHITDSGSYWEADPSFEVVDGFIFKISVKDLYSQQAARFDERGDLIKVYDHTDNSDIFALSSSHSFFVTFTSLTEANYIFSTNDRGGAITHSVTVSKDRITIYERGGYVLEAFKQFTTNKTYHIVIQWDTTGRRVFVDNEELFVTNKVMFYPEKIYFPTIKTDWVVDDLLYVTYNYKEYSVSYTRAYEYDKSITVPYKVSFVKSGNILNGAVQVKSDYVLLESISELNDVTDLRRKLEANRDLITEQKAGILKEYKIKALEMTAVQADMELNRINEMFASFDSLLAVNDTFSVMFDNESVQFNNLVVEKDEFKLKKFFDNILDINNQVFNEYTITPDTSVFLYKPEINQIIVGNSLFHYTQGLCRVSYILDNYDIFSRPLKLDEISAIYTNHDLYLASGELPEDIEVRWSLDKAIWDNYHSEMDFHKPKLWDIGDTYVVGMDNLLIKWYIASNYKGATFDCAIDKYIDHPKALVDWSVLYDPDVVVWDNVVNVTENINANNELYMLAELTDGSYLEYVKDKYLRHILKFLEDKDGNKYELDTHLSSKAILTDIQNNRAYKQKNIKYIPLVDFNASAIKIIERLPDFSGVVDFNTKLDEMKISVARPLVQMKGVYVLENPNLKPNPETLEIVIQGVSSYEYQKSQLEDFQGKTVYDSYVKLEFLASYDDPYIKTLRWDEYETTDTFETVLATVDNDSNYIIRVEELVYVLLSDGFKQILEPVEVQALQTSHVFVTDDGVEVAFTNEVIQQYPSTSFMDYSYKIRVEALGSDSTEYVIEIELGEEYMTDAKFQEEKYPKLCTRVGDGKIYLNMDTRANINNWPLARYYDYVYQMNEEFDMSLTGNGIGGVLESLVSLGFVILDLSKTLDMTKWKISTGDLSRKIKVQDNRFHDFDNNLIIIDNSKIYIGVQDDPNNEAIINKYLKQHKDQTNYYYINQVAERDYIDIEEFSKLKRVWQKDSNGNLLFDNLGKPIPVMNRYNDITRIYDLPYYKRREVLKKEIGVELAPTFLGYVGNFSVAQLQFEMSIKNNYTEDLPFMETPVNGYVNIDNPGYWVNSDGFEVQVQPDKEFVYYYDGEFKVPANLDPALKENTTLYIWVDSYRETIMKDDAGQSYYVETGTGHNKYITEADIPNMFYYVNKISGGNIPVPYLYTAPTSSTQWYVETGGNRLWRRNEELKEALYYYNDKGGVTPIEDVRMGEIYTVGGIGLIDYTVRFHVETPNDSNWFYFSDTLWNSSAAEHFRIFLTPYQLNLVNPDGTATLMISDEAGNIVEQTVQCYVPKYYVDNYNNQITVKETDYKSITKEYDGQEFISITTKVPTEVEEYIKISSTAKKEVMSFLANPYYVDRYGSNQPLFDRMDEVYYEPETNKYYVNVPEINHFRIYTDENNMWLSYYIGADGQKKYIDKTNFEWYSKSFLTNATKFIDDAYKKEVEAYKEVRNLSYYLDSTNVTRWLDNSGYEFLSAKESRYMYMTGDGRLYPTSANSLGRYYLDESNTVIYIEKYPEYLLSNGVWWDFTYLHDGTYVSREGMFSYRQADYALLGCTRTGNTLFHSV